MAVRLLMAMALACAPLCAQTVLNISDATQADEFLMIRYEVDHGVAAQAVQIDFAITTTAPDGIELDVFTDWNSYITTGILSHEEINNAGTLNLNVATPVRDGVHPVFIMVGGRSFSDPADLAGTVTFSVAGVTEASSGKHRFFEDGLYHSLCGVFADCTTFSAAGTTRHTVRLDAGAGQTFDFRVLTQGTDCSRIVVTSSQGGELDAYTPVQRSNVVGQGGYSITASGEVSISLRSEGGGANNYFLARFFLPTSVSIMGVEKGGAAGSKKKDGGDDGGGCTASAGHGASVLVLAGLLAARRRRPRLH